MIVSSSLLNWFTKTDARFRALLLAGCAVESLMILSKFSLLGSFLSFFFEFLILTIIYSLISVCVIYSIKYDIRSNADHYHVFHGSANLEGVLPASLCVAECDCGGLSSCLLLTCMSSRLIVVISLLYLCDHDYLVGTNVRIRARKY